MPPPPGDVPPPPGDVPPPPGDVPPPPSSLPEERPKLAPQPGVDEGLPGQGSDEPPPHFAPPIPVPTESVPSSPGGDDEISKGREAVPEAPDPFGGGTSSKTQPVDEEDLIIEDVLAEEAPDLAEKMDAPPPAEKGQVKSDGVCHVCGRNPVWSRERQRWFCEHCRRFL